MSPCKEDDSSGRNIPYDVNSPGVRGAGPHDSLINLLWYYYEQKPNVIARWVEEMGCGGAEAYPTVTPSVLIRPCLLECILIRPTI